MSDAVEVDLPKRGVPKLDIRGPAWLGAAAMAIIFAAAIAWTYMQESDRVARVNGTVALSDHTTSVLSLVGGVVRKVMVEDGAIVRAGQRLLRVQSAGKATNVATLNAEIVAARRRLIEIADASLPFEPNAGRAGKNRKRNAPQIAPRRAKQLERERLALERRIRELEAQMTRSAAPRAVSDIRAPIDGRIILLDNVAPEPVARRLRGDLDTIVMFALNKDPARRYESASAMAADVLLHLQGRPITARADSLGYRTGRFIARNPVGVGAGVVIVALLGWIAVSSVLQARSLRVERDRAQLEAQNAAEVANFLVELFEQSDPDIAAGEDPTARDLLARGAERIETELADQPATQIRLMRTIAEIEFELGNFEQAHRLLDKALARALPLLGLGDPETGIIVLRLGELHGDEGNFGAADSMLAVAQSIYESLEPPDPGAVAEVYTQRAQIAKEVGNFDLADSLYVRSLVFERMVDPVDSGNLSLTLNNYGEMLRSQGRIDEAEAPLREALAIRRRIFGEESVRVASSLNNLALVLKRQGKLEEALEIFEQILVVDRKILGDDHRYVGMDINNLATTLQSLGRYEEALERHREALALRRRIFDGPHPDTAVSLNNLGTTFRELGQLDSAQVYYEQALELNQEVFGDTHPRIAATMKNLASVWMARGDHARALEIQSEALAMRREVFGDEHPAVAGDLLLLAEILVALGRNQDALEAIDEAEKIAAGALPEGHRLRVEISALHADLHSR